MTLCTRHQDEIDRWRDVRKPQVLGVPMNAIGGRANPIPTHTRTYAIVMGQMQVIRTECASGRGCSK